MVVGVLVEEAFRRFPFSSTTLSLVLDECLYLFPLVLLVLQEVPDTSRDHAPSVLIRKSSTANKAPRTLQVVQIVQLERLVSLQSTCLMLNHSYS